jgi:hypothetical protein
MAVRLSALRTGRPLPTWRFLVLISVRDSSRLQDHSAAVMDIPIEKSISFIGNRTRDILSCSIVPKQLRYHLQSTYQVQSRRYVTSVSSTFPCAHANELLHCQVLTRVLLNYVTYLLTLLKIFFSPPSLAQSMSVVYEVIGLKITFINFLWLTSKYLAHFAEHNLNMNRHQ